MAETEGEPPFQFSSHGISALTYQGGKITAQSNKKIKFGKPGSMTCAGPLDCMIKVDGTIASDNAVRVCTDIDSAHARPNFCGDCLQNVSQVSGSRIVAQGEHVVKTKVSFCSLDGGQIEGWMVNYTMYDPT